MKLRFTLRAAFVALALFACCFSWLAHNARVRARELQAIRQLENMVGERRVATVPEWFHYTPRRANGVDDWKGIAVVYTDRSPKFLRPVLEYFRIDIFRRTIALHFRCEVDAETMKNLSLFRELKRVTFEPPESQR